MRTAPDLIAKLIAVACDDFAQWELVRSRFVLPLQLEILTEVARLTFVDEAGFRTFVGNVMGLVANFKAPALTKSNSIMAPAMPDG